MYLRYCRHTLKSQAIICVCVVGGEGGGNQTPFDLCIKSTSGINYSVCSMHVQDAAMEAYESRFLDKLESHFQIEIWCWYQSLRPVNQLMLMVVVMSVFPYLPPTMGDLSKSSMSYWMCVFCFACSISISQKNDADQYKMSLHPCLYWASCAHL